MKSREWLFNVTWGGEYSWPLPSEYEPTNVTGEDIFVHVIEKSYADELQSENEKLKEVLKRIAKTNASGVKIEEQGWYIAHQAIKDL